MCLQRRLASMWCRLMCLLCAYICIQGRKKGLGGGRQSWAWFMSVDSSLLLLPNHSFWASVLSLILLCVSIEFTFYHYFFFLGGTRSLHHMEVLLAAISDQNCAKCLHVFLCICMSVSMCHTADMCLFTTT